MNQITYMQESHLAPARQLDIAPEAPAHISQPAAPEKERLELRSWFRDIGETLLLTLLLFLTINGLTGRYEVQSVSMEPTLQEGQYLIISKISYRFHAPERGDIIVLRPPNGDADSLPYIKRLIGIPGDEVEVRNGRVWVNGTVLNESYISGPPTYSGAWTLGADEYFVLGDNRNNSSDSHAWGPLHRDQIIGKAVFRYWPLNRFGPFPNHIYPEVEAIP